MHTSRHITVTSCIRLILQHPTWRRHVETRQSTSSLIFCLQHSNDTEIQRWLRNPIKYGYHRSTEKQKLLYATKCIITKKSAANHTNTMNCRHWILTSYCSMTFSWAQNHRCVDSPFPSDLRAELRTKDEGKLDLSGLELLLLDPASGGGGDGEYDLTRFASSPFITRWSWSFFTWIFIAITRQELNTTTLKLPSWTP